MQPYHQSHLPQTIIAFAFLLQLLHPSSSSNKQTPNFKKVDLEGKQRSSVESSCTRLVKGESGVLAAGQLPDRFLLLTTDLLLFELHPAYYLEASKVPQPYRLLLNEAPSHLSDRFPGSYAAFAAIAHSIIYAFTLSFHYKSEEEKETYRKDYIAFVYFNESSPSDYCLFGIDFHADKPAHGPCSKAFSDIHVISYTPQMVFVSAYVRTDDHPQQMLCGIEVQEMTVLVGAQSASDEEKNEQERAPPASESTKQPCFTLEDCVDVMLVGEELNGKKEVTALREIPGRCTPFGSAEGGPLTSGFFISDSRVYLIDESATVHAMEDMSVRRVFASMPMGHFIGCNVQLPWNFAFNKTHIIFGIILFLTVQAIIAVAICYALNFFGDQQNQQQRPVKKVKRGRKGSRKKKSRRSSIESTEMSQRSSPIEGRSSISARKSRGSISRGSSKMSRKSAEKSSRGEKSISTTVSFSKRRGSILEDSGSGASSQLSTSQAVSKDKF